MQINQRSRSNKKFILFIINPIAGTNQKHKISKKINTIIDRQKYDYDMVFTEYSGHAFELAQQAVAQGNYMVVAVGGDGTVNEVANALINTPVVLGIVPSGSGNGLAVKLNIPTQTTKALQIINQHQYIGIDAGKINNKYFFSNAGLGFEGVAAHFFDQLNFRGFVAYAYTLLANIFSYHCLTYSITYSNKYGTKHTISTNAFLVNCGNSGLYGYGIEMTPQSKITDGLLEMAIVPKFKWWQSFWILINFALGRLHQTKLMRIEQITDVHIKANKSVLVQIDGDYFGEFISINMRVLPSVLQVAIK